MKIKLDENLPVLLAESLENLGHDVHTSLHEGMQGQPDRAIWHAAQAESRFLITQDLDFSDIHKFTPGTHAGILLVRLHEPSRRNLISTVENIFKTEDVEGWMGWFVIATERKTRVIKPTAHGT